MAGVRFPELQARPMAFLDCTSVTLDEFQPLVPPFEAAFHARMAAWRMDGKPHNHFPRAKLAWHLRCAARELLQPAGLRHARNHSLEHKTERRYRHAIYLHKFLLEYCTFVHYISPQKSRDSGCHVPCFPEESSHV